MFDSVCKFIRKHVKKSDTSRPSRPNGPTRSIQGRRMTGRWSSGKPPLQQSALGNKQLPLSNTGKPQRKRTSRTKDTSHETDNSPGTSETYEISMQNMDSKKETNYKLQIRRPTGNPNAIKRDLQKLNSNSTHSDDLDDSREEGEGDVGTNIGGSRTSLSQQTLLVVVTNVANESNKDFNREDVYE